MTTLCLGEALVDLIERQDRPGDIEKRAGGSPYNVACGLARHGHETVLGSWWAKDSDGALISAELRANGVLVMNGSDTAPRTSTAKANLDENFNATYTFDIDWRLPVGAEKQPASHIHTGSYGATEEPGASSVRAVIAAHPDATISYDPNIRPAIMAEQSVTVPIVEEIIGLSTLVKASDEDIAWMYGEHASASEEALAEICRRWLSLGPSLVVVTRGSEGAVAMSQGSEAMIAVPTSGTDVVDTVGAGDSFMAGLISGLLDAGLLGESARPLSEATAEQIVAALVRASKNAGVTVAHTGAYAPSRAEIDA
ncbi:PfkB family carbohydrate kinase [Trueperella pyogenes]|uniref:PfkB family carbohydrate kinase n=1 Tax=Trueperella pyogenes TaxID=1661 RepID=UPI00345DA7B4